MDSLTSHPHRFGQAPWRTILEFWGIYGVNLDYSAIVKLDANDILQALMWSEAVNPFIIKTGTRHYHYYNQSLTMWKKLLLKKVANGYKNMKLYEELQIKIHTYNECCPSNFKKSISISE